MLQPGRQTPLCRTLPNIFHPSAQIVMNYGAVSDLYISTELVEVVLHHSAADD